MKSDHTSPNSTRLLLLLFIFFNFSLIKAERYRSLQVFFINIYVHLAGQRFRSYQRPVFYFPHNMNFSYASTPALMALWRRFSGEPVRRCAVKKVRIGLTPEQEP